MWKKLDYFSVDYNAVAVADIFDIHNYLMKKNGMVWNVWICKVYICFGNDVFCCNISSVNSLNAISLNAVPLNTVPLIYVSVNNQECKMRLEIINISSNEPLFYPYSIKASKCSDSCSNINDPYSKLCVPDVLKNMNVKVI